MVVKKVLYEEWWNPATGGADKQAEKIREYINKAYKEIKIDKIANSNFINESDEVFWESHLGKRAEKYPLESLKTKNYDIIHAHATGNKLVEFNKKCKAPTIYTAHSLVIRELKEWGYSTNDAMKHSSAKVQDKMMKFSDIITTPSEYIKDLIYEHYPDYSDKVIVIPNGTDFFKYKRDKKVAMKANQIRRKYSPNGEKLIGFVGRITADKGAVDLAKAFKSLLDLGYNVKLFYIGPIYRDSKMAIDQVLKGNEYKYMYVGSIDDEMNLAAWYKALDMVVLPTYHESFSLVGLECLAMGTPFVVSYIDGPKEILVDNRLAIGILPKDISSIRDGIRYVIENSEWENKRAEKASNIIEKKYSLDNISERWINLYVDLYSTCNYKSVFLGDDNV